MTSSENNLISITKPAMPHWFNQRRTKEERKAIYTTLRLLGYDVSIATSLRGWRRTNIRKFIIHNKPKRIKK